MTIPPAGSPSRLSLTLASIPAVLPLTAIVGFSVFMQVRFAGTISVPWIVPDELIYSELAKSIASASLPGIRGVPMFGYGVLYPVLIAPAWLLSGDPESSYAAAKAINAVVMSLAALPAFLLARRFVATPWALGVALLTVLVPSLAYTAVVMTENAYYPLFLGFVWLLVRSIEQPTSARQAGVFVAIAALTLTRPQGFAMVGAAASAIVLHAIVERRADGPPIRAALARFRVTWMLVGGCVVLAVTWVLLRNVANSAPYTTALAGFTAAELPKWVVLSLAGIDLYAAFIPFTTTCIVIGLAWSSESTPRVRLFAAVVAPVTLFCLAVVAVFSASVDVDGHEVLNERYLFFVVPLLFVGLALWAAEGAARPRWAWPVVLVGAVLPALIPFASLAYNARFQALALVPWTESRAAGSAARPTVLAIGVFLGALVLALRPRLIWLLAVICGISFLAVGSLVSVSMKAASDYTRRVASPAVPGWVDDAVGRGARVDVVWPARGHDPRILWIVEFFNRSPGTVHETGAVRYSLPAYRVQVVGANVERSDGRALVAGLVLAPCSLGINGQVLATDAKTRMVLLHADAPLRVGGKGCGG